MNQKNRVFNLYHPARQRKMHVMIGRLLKFQLFFLVDNFIYSAIHLGETFRFGGGLHSFPAFLMKNILALILTAYCVSLLSCMQRSYVKKRARR